MVTFLTQYYPPETGAPQNRLSDLARRLASWGHQVEVLTALPSYPGNSVFKEYVGRHKTAEWIDGVRVLRLRLYVPRQKTSAGRLANYLSFAWNARIHGPGILSRCDILIMESPPLFLSLAGIYLARKLGAKLFTNISDLWPKSIVDLGIVSSRPLVWAGERLEAWTYLNSDLITAQTEGIADDIRRRFPNKRVVLLPNGVDLSAYDNPLDSEKIRQEFCWSKKDFVVGYTGIFGHAQALHQVLDAALLLRDIPHVRFALFGEGPLKEELEQRIRSEVIHSVRIHPNQPWERIPHIQSAFDAGLVPLANRQVFEGARPSKMFEIMAAGKPLILCGRGEAERLMRLEVGGLPGVVVPPENPPSLASTVRSLSSQRGLAIEMGRRGRKLVRDHFDREVIARDLERVLSDTLAGKSIVHA